jgi:predicted lipoprotein with Yx(FWY)xxD motif
MRKLLMVVPILLVVAACSSNSSSSSSPAPTATTANAKPTPAMATTTVQVVNNPTKGKILADASGRTLYKFDNDTTGKSNCEATCATTWPPLKFTGTGTPSGTTGLSTITRTDGSKQVAFDGAPLYTSSGDTAAGQTNGDGFAGKWHVVKAS